MVQVAALNVNTGLGDLPAAGSFMRLAPKAQYSLPAWGNAPGFMEAKKSRSAESAIHFHHDFVSLSVYASISKQSDSSHHL
jgi:hypothetical protein